MRILDLFCGAGGASMGYHLAHPDAEIVGVDINPQPRYPFTFIQADALAFDVSGFDFIHASPPCQHYSKTMRMMRNADAHPDLLAPTKKMLEASGARWVIENVDGAPFSWAYMLCGWGFGMPFHRHRYFQASEWQLQLEPACPGNMPEGMSINPYKSLNGRTMSELREAMGVQWMTLKETSEAIPPAYTQHIGSQL